MSALASRVARLEAKASPPVRGHFIYTRGPECSTEALHAFLAGLGVHVGPTDMVFHDTPGDPGVSEFVGEDEPLTLVGVDPITKRIEDLIAELDE